MSMLSLISRQQRFDLANALSNAIRDSIQNGKHEPDVVAHLTYLIPKHVNELNLVIGGYKLSTGGVFIHQTPRVTFDGMVDQNYIEIGDLLFINTIYAFYTHIIKSLNPKTGRAAMLWPHGVLFRDSEATIRKQVIEADLIEAVIGLGPNLFYNSSMESCVVVLRCNKSAERKNKILFINGIEQVTRERAHSRLSDENLRVLTEAYFHPEKQTSITALVDIEDIRANQHNLSIPLYVQNDSGHEVHDIEHAIEAWKVSRVKLKKQTTDLFKSLAELGYE